MLIPTIRVRTEEAMGAGAFPKGRDRSLPGPSGVKCRLTIRDLTKSTVRVGAQHQRGEAGVSYCNSTL